MSVSCQVILPHQDILARDIVLFFFSLGDAPGFPSKLHVALLLCSSFGSFGILSTTPFFFFLPHGPKANTKLRTYLQLATTATTLQKFRGIYLYCCHKLEKKKSKDDCVYTRQHDIKEHFSSCEDDGLFCLSYVLLLLLLLLLSPNYSLRGQFHTI